MSSPMTVVCACLAALAPVAAHALTGSEPDPRSALAWYFRIRPWEAWEDYAVYRWLGVTQFKRGLMFWYDVVFWWIHRSVGVHLLRQPQLTSEVWRRVNGQHFFSGASFREDLAASYRRTLRFELIHVFICLPIMPIALSLHQSERHIDAGMIHAVVVVTNVYPILLQRRNRSRILKIIRAETRKSHGATHEV